MRPSTRLTASLVVVLIIGSAAGWGLREWLLHQREQLQAEVVETRREQLAALLAVPGAPRWDDDAYLPALGRVLGATVQHLDARPAPPPRGKLVFDHTAPDGRRLRVILSMPATLRVFSLYSWCLALALLGLVLGLPAAFLLGSSRRTARPPDPSARGAEMASLARLARTTVAQSEALDHERAVRRRAEDDAALNQQLLRRAMEEKIRLGHDLHDGIIQSLYAVGLTLESVRPLVSADPTEADRRLDQCRDALNATIREVRAYITGLAPQNLSNANFLPTLQTLLATLTAGSEVELQLDVDPTALAQLDPDQAVELLQISREAVSNAVRHGTARHVRLRSSREGQTFAFSIEDDGLGFDPAAQRADGYGLNTMRARALRLGADLQITSRPGSGTRVRLTLPLPSPNS